MTELDAGSRIGRFELRGFLATGGFGVVYHALDPAGQPVAIKVLHAGTRDAIAVSRFEREAHALSALAHPNIVALHEAGHLPDGRPWLAMELLRGTDLDTLLRARERLSAIECMSILRALAGALDIAHSRGVIHRDIKASNVYLTTCGRVVLLDFGIAKLLDPAYDDLTATGTTPGTPGLMAPEQAAAGVVDARSDIYALGGLLFHLLTGRPAFAERRATEIEFLHRHARRPQPSEHAALPFAVDHVVAAAMAIDPEDRYATAGALAHAFAEAIMDES